MYGHDDKPCPWFEADGLRAVSLDQLAQDLACFGHPHYTTLSVRAAAVDGEEIEEISIATAWKRVRGSLLGVGAGQRDAPHNRGSWMSW